MVLYSTGFVVVSLIFLSIMYLAGTAGNILIVWTIARIKNMRSVQNMLVAFLAVVDFFIIGYLLPFSMNILITNRAPDRGLCRFQAIITAFLFSCSIQFIMFIALSRYFKICQSQKFNKVFTVRNIIIAAVVACAVAAAFASSLWFHDDLWIFEKPMHSCIFNRYGNVVFSVVFMSVILAVPAGVTAFCYIQIYRHVSQAKNQLHKHWNNGLARRKLTYEQMLTKTQFAVFIVYMLMYFPFGITAVGGQRSDYPDALHTVSIYMCYLNSCINSILYGILNKNMRKAYLESLPCIKQMHSGRVAPAISSVGNITQGTHVTPA